MVSSSEERGPCGGSEREPEWEPECESECEPGYAPSLPFLGGIWFFKNDFGFIGDVKGECFGF